jgi:pimeloyl-ACP methyl ester carboxylesterase
MFGGAESFDPRATLRTHMGAALTTLADTTIEHRRATVNGVSLHYVEAGPAGPRRAASPVILLHGFPEFWYAWRNQIPALARAGLRVIAPDMRGFGDSDKPGDVASYRIETLADDVAGLVRSIGAERATIVGHDWGGIVAWWFAMRHPDLLDRLSILNCPHPGRFLSMTFDPAQVKRSWYILFFQLPGVPERRMAADGYARMRKALARDAGREGAFTEADLDRYADAWNGALPTMVHYYRALMRRSPWAYRRLLRPIDKPVQVIWGARDPHIGFEYAEPPAKWVWDCRFDVLDDASHWLHLEAPDRVNALLSDFVRGGA